MSFDDFEEEKPWELRDDFKFAPEKPEGDPWALLGEPLFARDEKLCKVLRDEVNNLLLFAGLFSAVITAFATQSFQNLKPDPNADIISALSQISTNLININSNNGSMASSPATVLPSATFSPSDSAVRVNAVWFTSLIFSLSSVLVSIVALQWLRSHQTYSDITPRDSLAILNMRSESLHKWQVASIIMSLPVLLEVSLLLFFAGLIDFLISLGSKPVVVVVVAVAIGFPMLFLLVTTILPTAQAVLLRFSSKYTSRLFEKKLPPSQCPYKSPQSLAFHHAIAVALRSIRMLKFSFQGLFLGLSKYFLVLRRLKNQSFPQTGHQKAFLYHLSTVHTQDTWTDIDLAWLGVRDAAQHSADDLSQHDTDEFDQFSITERSLPLYDIVQSFQKATGADYSHAFGSALYHCFSELSYASVMTFGMKRFRQHIFRPDNTWNEISQNVLERNRYFQSLIISGKREDNMRDGFRDVVMASRNPSDFINFGPPQYLHILMSNIHILHHQNLLLHLDNLTGNDRYSKTMSNHRKEIMIRLGKALYSRDIALRPGTISLPPYLRGKIFEQGLSNLYSDLNLVSLFHQYSCTVSDFFGHAANTPTTLLTPPYLSTHSDIPEFIENAGWDMYRSLVAFSLPRTASNDHIKVTNTFHKVVDGLIEHLQQPAKLEKPGSGTTDYSFPHSSPSYLLYCSAIYARRLSALIGLGKATHNKLPDEVLDKLNLLLREMSSYKAQLSIDSTKDDFTKFLEARFRGIDRYGGVYRFCQEWWSFLDAGAGHSNNTIMRTRSTWFEDAFFDQLRRVTSSTLAYASPLITVQDTQNLSVAPETPADLNPESITGRANYALQFVQVPIETVLPTVEYDGRIRNPSVVRTSDPIAGGILDSGLGAKDENHGP